MIRYGYACINMELSEQGIRTGRTMIDRKFKLGGLQLASDISLANARDLITILKWNEARDIRLFRLGSELFPRWNHYRLEDLPDINEIAKHLRAAGDYAKAHGHRITTHPGPFHILGIGRAIKKELTTLKILINNMHTFVITWSVLIKPNTFWAILLIVLTVLIMLFNIVAAFCGCNIRLDISDNSF